MEPLHDHVPKAACLPSCPAWAELGLRFFALQRRYPEMLEACRTAEAIDWIDVAPDTQGVVLPDYLKQDEVVRLSMVVGRDTPEVLLDEWGIRCNLTFRGGRRFDCAFPWPAVLRGLLRRPERKRPRFGVIAGTDDAARPAPAPAAEPLAPAPEGARPEPQRPTGAPRFGVIEGGKGKKD